MVNKYKRTSDRQSWNENDMKAAIDAVNTGQMGWLKASKTFNVPQATLRRHYGGKNIRANNGVKTLGRFCPVFSSELEKKLVAHIVELESQLFGLTSSEVRRLAFQLAERMGINSCFNAEKKIAGKDWFIGFRKRNPEISLRQPEPTSAARAQAFNRPQVEKFFSLLSTTIDKHDIQPARMFNMDESALTTVQKPPKIFASRGKKQVGALTSAERGLHVTVVACVSSSGVYVPPAMIFPRKKLNPTLYDEAPTGTLRLCSESGYMTSDLFVK